MIIIFEGVDKVGKSSLVQSFKERYDDAIICRMSSPRNLDAEFYREVIATEYLLLYRLIEDNPDKLWILDRSHFSEMVYAPVKRKYKIKPVYQELTAWLKAKEHVVIYLYNKDPAVLQERRILDEDDYLNLSESDEIMRKYEEVWAKHSAGLNLVQIDATPYTFEQIYYRISFLMQDVAKRFGNDFDPMKERKYL
jgi:thymidylate kinase